MIGHQWSSFTDGQPCDYPENIHLKINSVLIFIMHFSSNGVSLEQPITIFTSEFGIFNLNNDNLLDWYQNLWFPLLFVYLFIKRGIFNGVRGLLILSKYPCPPISVKIIFPFFLNYSDVGTRFVLGILCNSYLTLSW